MCIVLTNNVVTLETVIISEILGQKNEEFEKRMTYGSVL